AVVNLEGVPLVIGRGKILAVVPRGNRLAVALPAVVLTSGPSRRCRAIDGTAGGEHQAPGAGLADGDAGEPWPRWVALGVVHDRVAALLQGCLLADESHATERAVDVAREQRVDCPSRRAA